MSATLRHNSQTQPSPKVTSKVMSAIEDAEPNFGPSLTLAHYDTEINSFNARLDSYNENLSTIDQLLNELEAAETNLRESNRRMLATAQAHYGPDSSEYEQVGGTRTSDRKRPGPKGESPATPPASVP